MILHARMVRRLLLPALFLLLAAGCQPVQPSPIASTPTPEPTPIASVPPAATPLTLTVELTGTGTLTETVSLTETAPVTETAPLLPPEPVLLAIPEIDMEAPVEAMGWEVVIEEGARTTRWVLPEEAAGWHVNSARAGAAGNVIISGRQASGAAVFAPLALGDVLLDQDIVLTDSDGNSFIYRVTEISEPLPLRGGAAVDQALAAYTEQEGIARLTLISGWPDFTTTHRLVVVAELIGPGD